MDQLIGVNDEEYADVFGSNINVIFQYSEKDISSVLDNKDLEIVLNIRNKLCERVKESFPEYANRRFINRQVKHLAIQDIISMANSILRDSTVRKMEKVFVAKTTDDVENDLILNDFDAADPTSVSTQISLLASEIKRLRTLCNASQVQCSCKCNCVNSESDVPVSKAVASSSNSPVVLDDAVSNSANHAFSDARSDSDKSQGSSGSEEEEDSPSFQIPRKNHKKRKQNVQPITAAVRGPDSSSQRDLYVGNIDPKCNIRKMKSHIQRHGYNITDKDIVQLHKGSDYSSFRVTIPITKYDMVSKIWSKGIKVRPFSPSKGRSGKPPVRRKSSIGSHNPNAGRRNTDSENFDTFKAGYDKAMQDARRSYANYSPTVMPPVPYTSRRVLDSHPFPDGKRFLQRCHSSCPSYDNEWPRLPSVW